MGIRIYICPVIGDGLSPATAWRPKAADLVNSGVERFEAVLQQRMADFAWTLAIARSSSWTAADADAQLERVFGIDLPDNINTWPEVKAFLQSKTVGDIPAARRLALQTRLEAKGIDTSQTTLQTTWWQVLRGIVRHLNNGVLPSEDGFSMS